MLPCYLLRARIAAAHLHLPPWMDLVEFENKHLLNEQWKGLNAWNQRNGLCNQGTTKNWDIKKNIKSSTGRTNGLEDRTHTDMTNFTISRVLADRKTSDRWKSSLR